MKVDFHKMQIAMANACMNSADVAAASKVSKTSIAKYLSGKREPQPKSIGKIAKALNVSVEDLIQMEGGD